MGEYAVVVLGKDCINILILEIALSLRRSLVCSYELLLLLTT